MAAIAICGETGLVTETTGLGETVLIFAITARFCLAVTAIVLVGQIEVEC